ncbi:MAG: proteasome subunit alpha [Actinobacteria bacterium]|nr:proteasome subunit alpha [Actinomycetota bacterium]
MTVPFYVPPEQLMKDRAEYARKGIARGKSIAAVEYADGILLLAENPSGTLHKIGEIYDRIAFAGVGKYSEFETLRVAGIRHADLKGYAYSRSDVTAKSLANAYSHALGRIFTQEVKPYEVGIMVAEVGDLPEDSLLFKVTYDGALTAEDDVAAIGGQEEQLAAHLRESFRPGAPLAEAIRWAIAAFEAASSRTIGPEEWEAAVVDRTLGRRAFRRLTAAEMAGS